MSLKVPFFVGDGHFLVVATCDLWIKTNLLWCANCTLYN